MMWLGSFLLNTVQIIYVVGSDPDSGAEDPDRRGSTTGSYKKFSLLFPLIAVFKFLIIKLLHIPILIGVFAIKKMLVAAAMALPTLLQLFRCPRNPLVPGAPGAGGRDGGGGSALEPRPRQLLLCRCRG